MERGIGPRSHSYSEELGEGVDGDVPNCFLGLVSYYEATCFLLFSLGYARLRKSIDKDQRSVRSSGVETRVLWIWIPSDVLDIICSRLISTLDEKIKRLRSLYLGILYFGVKDPRSNTK